MESSNIESPQCDQQDKTTKSSLLNNDEDANLNKFLKKAQKVCGISEEEKASQSFEIQPQKKSKLEFILYG